MHGQAEFMRVNLPSPDRGECQLLDKCWRSHDLRSYAFIGGQQTVPRSGGEFWAQQSWTTTTPLKEQRQAQRLYARASILLISRITIFRSFSLIKPLRCKLCRVVFMN